MALMVPEVLIEPPFGLNTTRVCLMTFPCSSLKPALIRSLRLKERLFVTVSRLKELLFVTVSRLKELLFVTVSRLKP